MNTKEFTLEEAHELLGSLTFGELGFITKLSELEDRAGYVSNASEAGIAGQLKKKNVIRPFGKMGRLQRWQLSESIFRYGRLFLREMMGARK